MQENPCPHKDSLFFKKFAKNLRPNGNAVPNNGTAKIQASEILSETERTNSPFSSP